MPTEQDIRQWFEKLLKDFIHDEIVVEHVNEVVATTPFPTKMGMPTSRISFRIRIASEFSVSKGSL